MPDEKSLQSIAYEEKLQECPDCGSEEIVFDNGETICVKCGLVID